MSKIIDEPPGKYVEKALLIQIIPVFAEYESDAEVDEHV